jgi:hypothetical protein
MSSVALPIHLTSPVADAADRWRRRLLVLYVGLLPFMVVTDLPWLGHKVQLTEVAFLGLLVVWGRRIASGAATAVRPPVTTGLIAWLVIASLSALRALHPRDAVLEVAAWVYLAALCVVLATSIRSWDDWRLVVAAWLIASALTAALAVAGWLGGTRWDLATPFAIRVDPLSVIRTPFWVGIGFMWASKTPNMVIGYLLAGSLLALGMLWSARTRRARWLAAAAVAIHALAVGVTVSRVAIAVGFALLIFLLRFRSYGAEILRWVLLVAWLAFVATVELVSYVQPAAITISRHDLEEPAAAAYRKQYFWHLRADAPVHRLEVATVYAPFARTMLSLAALDFWRERPWLGIGPGGFARELQRRQAQDGERWRGLLVLKPWDPHSTYLGALAETGTLGLVALLAVFAMIVRQAIVAVRLNTDPTRAALLWAVLAALAGYLVAAFDDDLVTKRWFWVMAALAVSACMLVRRDRAAART